MKKFQKKLKKLEKEKSENLSKEAEVDKKIILLDDLLSKLKETKKEVDDEKKEIRSGVEKTLKNIDQERKKIENLEAKLKIS